MATSDKLNKLSQTKENIKTAIESKGQVVGAIPFGEYPSKINAINADLSGDATAVANDMRAGKTAYVNGVKVTGRLISPLLNQGQLIYSSRIGSSAKLQLLHHLDFVGNAAIVKDNINPDGISPLLLPDSVSGVAPGKIKMGETILGVIGAFTDSGMSKVASTNIDDTEDDGFGIKGKQINDLMNSNSEVVVTALLFKAYVVGVGTACRIYKDDYPGVLVRNLADISSVGQVTKDITITTELPEEGILVYNPDRNNIKIKKGNGTPESKIIIFAYVL